METTAPAPLYEIVRETDVPYGEAPGFWTEAPVRSPFPIFKMMRIFGRRRNLPLTMDLYVPVADPAESRPLLLMMHGGAFFIGNKGESGQVAWCRHFASLGYVAASINYRLGFRLSAKGIRQAEQDALEDADCALACLMGRKDLRIDPQRVFVAGTSAGAVTALNLAYGLYGDRPMDGFRPKLGAGFRIRAVGDLWGYVRDLDMLERARIPIIAFQSEKDPVVPFDSGYPLKAKWFAGKVYGTKATCERAAALGICCRHYPCPEERHKLHLDESWQLTPRFYEIRDKMAAFFAAILESDTV